MDTDSEGNVETFQNQIGWLRKTFRSYDALRSIEFDHSIHHAACSKRLLGETSNPGDVVTKFFTFTFEAKNVMIW